VASGGLQACAVLEGQLARRGYLCSGFHMLPGTISHSYRCCLVWLAKRHPKLTQTCPPQHHTPLLLASFTPPPHTHTTPPHTPHTLSRVNTLLDADPMASPGCTCRVDTRRRDFLSAGTMAKGAAESGVAESYMCAKVARNPLVQRSCAAYLGEFEAQEGANNINKGTQWLVRGGLGHGGEKPWTQGGQGKGAEGGGLQLCCLVGGVCAGGCQQHQQEHTVAGETRETLDAKGVGWGGVGWGVLRGWAGRGRWRGPQAARDGRGITRYLRG
jgi:hypothetical protein